MARREKVPASEREIGLRLRQFRESKLISRTAFAVSVGIGYQRLESYEAGRVPLPYGVYRAINAKYFLTAQWLVTGEGMAFWSQPFDDSVFKDKPDDRELLSAVYDRLLQEKHIDLTLDVLSTVYGPTGLLSATRSFMDCLRDPAQTKKFPHLTLELVRSQMLEWAQELDQYLSEEDALAKTGKRKTSKKRRT